MKDFVVDEKTLEFFRHEIETHTRPIDEMSKEIELFEGINFSVDDLITEINCGIDLRINYLKRIRRDWEIEYNSMIWEAERNSMISEELKAKQKHYLDMTADMISRLEALQRYLNKDFEICCVGTSGNNLKQD